MAPAVGWGDVPRLPHRKPKKQPSRWATFIQRVTIVTRSFFLHESPWIQRLSPSFLHPDYYWKHTVLASDLQCQQLPDLAPFTSSRWRRWLGRIHYTLVWFSTFYCAWYGFEHSYTIVPLPFGLVLKRSDGTSFDEAQSMMAIRKAGFPCPKVISVGENQEGDNSPASILMTRVPGEMLDEIYQDLDPSDQTRLVAEISQMLAIMRMWKNPWGSRICSISGGPMRSTRVPMHKVGSCESETEFTEYLLSASSPHGFKTTEEFEEKLSQAKTLYDYQHRIVFSHGDFALHNILVHDGHVSGFIDWECAGWYPEYWDFTTPMRLPSRDPEGGAFFRRLGGHQYESELVAEKALWPLTVSSWVW